MIKLNSIVGLITNSSTTIYTCATKGTIKAAIKLLEAVGGNKDEFDFKLYPGDDLLETVWDDAEEYLTSKQLRKLESFKSEPTYKNGFDYLTKLIINKEIEYPNKNSEGYLHEW